MHVLRKRKYSWVKLAVSKWDKRKGQALNMLEYVSDPDNQVR